MTELTSIFSTPPNKSAIKRNYGYLTDVLTERHPRLKKLIQSIGHLEFEIPIWDSLDNAVVYSVIGQMLSIKASKAIISRLLVEFKTPKNILVWAEKSAKKSGALRGVSFRKRKALAEWSKYYRKNRSNCAKWENLSLLEYRDEITQIWGFGPWAADMIAIFYLGRMDVWPQNDSGIQKASKIIFGTVDSKEILTYVQGCETVAALYFWEMLNRRIVV